MRCATAVLAAASLALSSAALAAGAGRIAVELNDLQVGDGGGCRAVFVLKNDIGQPLDKLTLRVVAFDQKGRATLFLSLDVGALTVGKTRILRFDLGDKVACTDVARMVLDDVTACAGDGLTPPACLAAIALSSRASVPLDF